MTQCLKDHTLKSALDSSLTPAKYCVSLRKLLNHSVHQIMGIMIALNLRVVAGMKEMILVTSLVPVPCSYRIMAQYSFMKTVFHFNKELQQTHALPARVLVGRILGVLQMTACEQMPILCVGQRNLCRPLWGTEHQVTWLLPLSLREKPCSDPGS